MNELQKLIFTRRNAIIKNKTDVWDLCIDSFIGGQRFIDGKHLFRLPRESSVEFSERLKRSVYFNYLQPLTEILIGLVYLTEPTREYDPSMQYVIDTISNNMGLDKFIQLVATNALLSACGVLVDSPAFDAEMITTEADRRALGLNPYAVLYTYDRIRDFAYDGNGNLLWILLDDSYVDNADPFRPEQQITKYTLWTRDYHQSFINMNDKDVAQTEQMPHNVGYVPFHFINIKDIDSDNISDVIAEDIALISRGVYNIVSYMDQMLAEASHRVLFFPYNPDAPDSATDITTTFKDGYAEVAVIPYDGKAGQPFFAGVDLQNIDSYITVIDRYAQEIFRKIGMRPDDKDSGVPQSGRARSFDFKKTEAILQSIVEALEETEYFIFETTAAWENKTISVDINYNKTFEMEDIYDRFNLLKELFNSYSNTLKSMAHKEAAKIAFPDIEEAELNAIHAEMVQKPVSNNIVETAEVAI